MSEPSDQPLRSAGVEGTEGSGSTGRDGAGIRAGVTAENREVSVTEQCLIDMGTEPGLGGVGDSLEGKVEGLGGNGGGLRWRDVEEWFGCR